jgi:hypothetical protein
MLIVVDLGNVHLMLVLMRLRIGMHQMVLLCFIALLMHPMCFIVKMIELLLPMWDQNVRRVRLAFGFHNLM